MTVQRLSESFLDKRKMPPDRDVIYWDTLVPGFGVKHCARTGTKSYFYRYDVYVTVDGERKRKEKRPVISNSPRMTLDDARNEARRRLAAVKDGIQIVSARQEPSVSELAGKWENSVAGREAAKKPSWKDTRSEMKHIQATFGALRLSELSRECVRSWHEAHATTPVMANAVIKRLRRLWVWARQRTSSPHRPRHRPSSSATSPSIRSMAERRSIRTKYSPPICMLSIGTSRLATGRPCRSWR